MRRAPGWRGWCAALLLAPAAAAGAFPYSFDVRESEMTLSAYSENVPGATRAEKIERVKQALTAEVRQKALCQDGHYLVAAGTFPQFITLRAACRDAHLRRDEEFLASLRGGTLPAGLKEPLLPIHAAARRHFPSSIRFLVEQDAKNLAARDAAGNTPLALALVEPGPWWPKYAAVEMLLLLGADPNLAAGVRGSPLQLLARSLPRLEPDGLEAENPEAIELFALLLKHGASPRAGVAGASALHHVARLGWVSLIARLLERGADLHGVDLQGRSALWEARYPAFRELLERKARINHKDKYGESVLFQLVKDRLPDSLERIELALRHGAQVNLRNPAGLTALWLLTEDGNPYLKLASDRERELAAAKRTIMIAAGAVR